jgi:hypothetical protein
VSDCSFRIPFSGDADALIRKARQAITGAGGSFEGDSASGRFTLSIIGKMDGNYRVDGDALHVVISKKPLMIACSRIEKELKNYLQQEL